MKQAIKLIDRMRKLKLPCADDKAREMVASDIQAAIFTDLIIPRSNYGYYPGEEDIGFDFTEHARHDKCQACALGTGALVMCNINGYKDKIDSVNSQASSAALLAACFPITDLFLMERFFEDSLDELETEAELFHWSVIFRDKILYELNNLDAHELYERIKANAYRTFITWSKESEWQKVQTLNRLRKALDAKFIEPTSEDHEAAEYGADNEWAQGCDFWRVVVFAQLYLMSEVTWNTETWEKSDFDDVIASAVENYKQFALDWGFTECEVSHDFRSWSECPLDTSEFTDKVIAETVVS